MVNSSKCPNGPRVTGVTLLLLQALRICLSFLAKFKFNCVKFYNAKILSPTASDHCFGLLDFITAVGVPTFTQWNISPRRFFCLWFVTIRVIGTSKKIRKPAACALELQPTT